MNSGKELMDKEFYLHIKEILSAAAYSRENELQAKLGQGVEAIEKQKEVQSRLDTIYAVFDRLKNHPMSYNDETVNSWNRMVESLKGLINFCQIP